MLYFFYCYAKIDVDIILGKCIYINKAMVNQEVMDITERMKEVGDNERIMEV